MRTFSIISIITIIAVLMAISYRNSPPYHSLDGEIFGTYYNIKTRTNLKNNALDGQIKQKLKHINNIFSVFDPLSELSQLNQAGADKEIRLSSELSFVLQQANNVWNITNGAFDPTLGPLINAWGFGKDNRQTPSDNQIAEIKKYVGFDKLLFSPDFNSVIKTHPQIAINLSAIAKGYAIDEIASLLDNAGLEDYLIEIGGEIKAKGYRSSDNIPWSVGINTPIAGTNQNSLVLSLSNLAVATSGNYRNFYTQNGRIYSHIISPKTGYPSNSDVLSVSVFHASCSMADAFATGFLVMGAEKALQLADKNNLAVIIIDNKQNTLFSLKARQMFME